MAESTGSRGFTRRRVLQAVPAVAAVPYIIPSGVLAAAGRPGANDRVGVGYIGAGRRAGGLYRLGAEARMVAVADVDIARAKRAAGRGKAQAYQDYRKMLEQKDLDAVVVSTPDHWHALPSIHACQAGKDVYCEKPMTLTIREGRLMAQAVRKYKRVFQTGSQQRSMQANRHGCELIRNGRLGKLKIVLGSNYPSPWNCALPAQDAPATLNWDMWCGPTKPRAYHSDIYRARANPGWISFREYSGGEMTGWGAHGLDQVQWALGMDESGPVEIWTEGPKFNPPTYTKPAGRGEGNKACATPTVFYKYADGTVLKLGGGPGGGAVFEGENGKITIDRGRAKGSPASLVTEPLKDPKVKLYVSKNHMQNWIDCIKSRKRCVADVEIGHRSATVCHLGNIARWLGRKLHWDPAKEKFVGDDEANTYLDRPRRKPYDLPETV